MGYLPWRSLPYPGAYCDSPRIDTEREGRRLGSRDQRNAKCFVYIGQGRTADIPRSDHSIGMTVLTLTVTSEGVGGCIKSQTPNTIKKPSLSSFLFALSSLSFDR